MKTKATKLLRLLVCVMLASVLLVSILPMQAFAAQEAEASNEIDISAITIENLPEILKQEMDITPDYSSALGINTNTYSLRETTVLKTGLLASDAQRLDGLTLVNPDGTKTAYSFGADIKFIEDNAVKFVDNQIINKVSLENGRLFFYQTKDSDNMLYLPLNISSGLLFKNGDLSLTLAPASFSFSFAQLKEDGNEYAVRYDNVFAKGISLEYLSVYGGFKENIIINEKNGINEFSYVLDIPGYKAELTDGGKRITVTSKEDGENAYVFGHPFAQDANGKITNDCDYTLKHLFGDRYILTLRADEQFLNDESTAYPVTVDPPLTTFPLQVSRGSVEDMTVASAGASDSTSSTVAVGINGSSEFAAYVKCNFLWYFRHLCPEDISNAQFKTAALEVISPIRLNLYDSNGIININNTDNMTLDGLTQYQDSRVTYVDVDEDGDACDFNITALMYKWLKYYLNEGGKNPEYGFIIRSDATTSENNKTWLYSAESTQTVYPYFTITYNEQNTIEEGYYYFKNQQYGSNLLFEEAALGANVFSGEIEHGMYARWYIKLDETTDYGEKLYTITPNNSSTVYMCTDASDAYANNGNITIDYSEQRWRIIKNGDGSYRIMPANSTLQCLTTDNSGEYNAYTYEYYAWPSMKWQLEELTHGVGAAFAWNNGYENSEDVNCLGYALGINAWPNVAMGYGDSVSTIYDRTEDHVENILNRTIYLLESADAPLRPNEYRVAMRVGNYEDSAEDAVGDVFYREGEYLQYRGTYYLTKNTYYVDKATNSYVWIDRFLDFDYHYMRQSVIYDDEGNERVVWAEKHGQTSVNPATDIREGNPSTMSWSKAAAFKAYMLENSVYRLLYLYAEKDSNNKITHINPTTNATKVPNFIYPEVIVVRDSNNIIDDTNFYNSDTIYFAVSIS